MDIKAYTCPCCNAPLDYDAASGKLKCESCGNEFELSDMDAMNAPEENTTELEFESPKAAFSSEEQAQMQAFICQNCGAELVTDGTTTATECAYCGSPTVLPGRIENNVKPDKVLPFKVTKEQAEKTFGDYFTGKKLLPNVFLDSRNRISDIRKLYVPYWLFDCDAAGDMLFNAEKTETHRQGEWEVQKTRHYLVRRRGYLSFESIPVDACAKLDDKIGESLEPFPMQEAVPFAPAVLAGAMADAADVDEEKCTVRAKERVEASMEDALRNTVNGYDRVSVRRKVIRSRKGKVTPVLMPVWYINTEKTENGEKKVYTFAINGQTGNLTCDVPYAKGKAWAWFGALFGGITAVGCGLCALLKAESMWMLIAAVLALIVALVVVNNLKAQLKTAHSKREASDYARRDSFDLEVKEDRFLYTTTQRRKIETQKK